MKQIIFILIFILSKTAFCQILFVVDDFSKDYFGELFIADTSKVFSKGWIAIYDKNQKNELIKVISDELTYELPNGQSMAKIMELPFVEQNYILIEDYNFDGINDFAIMDGQFGCYHGPSYQVYLATAKGFIQSPEFSELTRNCSFDVDQKNKIIRTMTKSGCCWHQYSEFKVKDNKPYVIKTVTEGMSDSGIDANPE